MSVYKNKKTQKWDVQIYYKDLYGKKKNKHKRGFKTKKEALAFERDFLAKNEGSLDMRFCDFVDLYLKDKKRSWSPTTYATNESKFRNWILPYLGEKPINQIKPLEIRQWQVKILDSDLSPVTQKKIYQELIACFNYAERFYDLKDNPCNKVDSIGTSKREKVTFWTLDEFNEFLDYVDNPNFKLAYKVLFFTGLRIGELTALRPCDFDFSVPKLTVNRNLQIVNGQELFLKPKTEKSKRDVILPKELAQEIKDFIDKHHGMKEEDRIFFYNKKSYGNKLTKICKENNLKRIRLHDLRHSHASYLIELGFSPLLIAERLGHESVQITLQIYSHLYPSKQEEAAEKINQIMQSQPLVNHK